MTKHLTVNRTLSDKAMDHIDHALGRPLDPLGETYRNHFAIHDDSDQAAEFRASPYWSCTRDFCGMVYFHVTQEGRRALSAHLKEIGDPHKSFIVKFEYCGEADSATVVAAKASEAKYRRWLEVTDLSDLMTFKEFCKTASVRRAA